MTSLLVGPRRDPGRTAGEIQMTGKVVEDFVGLLSSIASTWLIQLRG
jgi:hypothetical protein